MLPIKNIANKGGMVLVAMDGAEPPMSSNSADFSAVEVSVTETLQSCLSLHPHPILQPSKFSGGCFKDISKTYSCFKG